MVPHLITISWQSPKAPWHSIWGFCLPCFRYWGWRKVSLLLFIVWPWDRKVWWTSQQQEAALWRMCVYYVCAFCLPCDRYLEVGDMCLCHYWLCEIRHKRVVNNSRRTIGGPLECVCDYVCTFLDHPLERLPHHLESRVRVCPLMSLPDLKQDYLSWAIIGRNYGASLDNHLMAISTGTMTEYLVFLSPLYYILRLEKLMSMRNSRLCWMCYGAKWKLRHLNASVYHNWINLLSTQLQYSVSVSTCWYRFWRLRLWRFEAWSTFQKLYKSHGNHEVTYIFT